jgi:hypothetical protein
LNHAGIFSHEGTDAADGVCQGDGLEQSLDCAVKTLQKAPNEAKLEFTQSTSSQGFESRNAERVGANEAKPRRVGRLSGARAMIGLKRLCRRAKAAGRLGAAKVVRCQKQLRPRGLAQDAEGATRS